MQRTQSKWTQFLLLWLGLLAFIGLLFVARIATQSSQPSASVHSATTNGGVAPNALAEDTLLPTADAQRDTRAAATTELSGPTATLIAEAPADTIEIHVVERATKQSIAGAEVLMLELPKERWFEIDTWQWLSNGELDSHMERDAVKATTDSDGRVRLKRTQYGAIVVARTAELWGFEDCGPNDEVPWRVEVVRDAALSARVVDARDAPVAGGRVCLRMRSGEWFWDTVMAESRESDGIAILPHAGYMLRQQNGGQTAASVALGGVFEKAVEVVLDLEKLPKEPVRLVVPSTGECEVLVVGLDGQPCLDEYNVDLRPLTPEETAAVDSPRSERSAYRISGVRGRALFHHVAPGFELLASAGRPGANSTHSARGPGPTAVGRRATITVRLGETLAIVRGRALDANGAPLKRTKFNAWVAGGKEDENGVDHNWALESDDAGRFHVEIRPRTIEDGACSIVLIEPDERGVELRSAIRPLPANLPAGVHELGDFALAPTPTIVTGRVVDGNNAPVRSALVEVSIKHKNGDSEDEFWWGQLWTVNAMSDADGRFALRGRVTADTLAIAAQKDGSKATAVMVRPGAADVVLRMGATGEIAGRVLLDPSVSKTRVQLLAERTDGDRSNDLDANYWTPAHLGDDGSFVLRSLRAGVYSVKLRLSGSWDEVQAVEGVRVDSGVTMRDPRLNPLDLRTSLVAITVTIVDPDGQPVQHGSIQVTHPQKNGESKYSYAHFENGKGTVTHDGRDVELLITSPGFRATRIEKVRDDRTVTLLRAPRVRLVLAGGVRAPEKPFQLGVDFSPVEGSAVGSWSEETAYFDSRGQISTFAPAVGRMRVGFSVTFRPNENSWSSTSFAPEEEIIIDVRDISTEQVFEVKFDAKQLAAMIESLRKEDR